MKKGIQKIFWVISVLLVILAIYFFTVGIVSGFLMLLCAVVINPIILEKLIRRKGLSAGLLVFGLMVASIAVLPKTSDQTYMPSIQSEANQSAVSGVPDAIKIGEQALKKLAYDETSQIGWAAAAALPQGDKTPYKLAVPSATIPPATTKPAVTGNADYQTTADTRKGIAGIEIVYYTETIARGDYASIEIKGVPNTTYNCQVEYKSGPSKAKGLGDKDSDGEGYASWIWKVGTNTSLDYRPTIYVSGGGDSISVRFQVVE